MQRAFVSACRLPGEAELSALAATLILDRQSSLELDRSRALVNWWFYGRRVHHRLMNSLRRQGHNIKDTEFNALPSACPWCAKILTQKATE
jgi:hypothetical protein